MLFKPTSQTLPLSILQETAELVVPVPSFAQTTNQQPAWLFGNGFKINSKVGGSPTEGWSKRGQCRQVEIAEVYYTFFSNLSIFSHFFVLIPLPYSNISGKTCSGVLFHEDDKKESKLRLVYTESIWTDKFLIKCFETIKDLDPMKRRITVKLTNFEK